MERKRGQIIAVVIALVVAVVSLGVAFAAFSTTLNISGTATVQASSWNIFFTSTRDSRSRPEKRNPQIRQRRTSSPPCHTTSELR